MNLFFSRVLTIALIFSGEALAICAEMIAARSNFVTSQLFLKVFLKIFLIIIIGGVFLIFGYTLGFNTFKNIWIVSVISITSILVIEPILAFTIFHQLPTKGAIAGLVFGAIGFISTIFIR
jgi:hypothetical protein